MYTFLQPREKLTQSIMSYHRKSNMHKQNFMLFSALFLAAGSTSYGDGRGMTLSPHGFSSGLQDDTHRLAQISESETEEDHSGDSPLLSSTVITTPSPERSTVLSTAALDSDLKPSTTPEAPKLGFETGNNATTESKDENNNNTEMAGVNPALIYGVPAVLLIILILLIIAFVIWHKKKKSKQDELGSENVKSPIFEEDTPSVMEIEMEELDKWMNSMNKNAESECLPTVKEEEKDSNANQSSDSGAQDTLTETL
ncbi:PREDICTED: transmembrane protein 154 [Gavialis gangeticus]|uniref:transmembrane protein 154 n=1 Tax=Gavialis gangeticus TaxID=94835 RepID=UPI00092E4C0F|nr:PREDICTED: transmembrane protein 154 [Gavialis gangeticus]